MKFMHPQKTNSAIFWRFQAVAARSIFRRNYSGLYRESRVDVSIPPLSANLQSCHRQRTGVPPEHTAKVTASTIRSKITSSRRARPAESATTAGTPSASSATELSLLTSTATSRHSTDSIRPPSNHTHFTSHAESTVAESPSRPPGSRSRTSLRKQLPRRSSHENGILRR